MSLIDEFLMRVPDALRASYLAGATTLKGSILRNAANGRIVGHLQPSSGLLSMLAGGPINVGAGVIKAATSLGSTTQFVALQQMLSTLQIVSAVGAASSVLNLGVSIAGFAMVLSRLKKLDAHLGQVEVKVDWIRDFLHNVRQAETTAALAQCEEAFSLHGERRSTQWLHAKSALDVSSKFALGAVAATAGTKADRIQLSSLGKSGAEQITELIAPPLMFAQARIEALLCLESPNAARDVAQETHGWLDSVDFFADQYVSTRAAGVVLDDHAAKAVIDEAKGIRDFLELAKTCFSDRAELCSTLEENEINSLEFVERIRDYDEPDLLILNAQKAKE